MRPAILALVARPMIFSAVAGADEPDAGRPLYHFTPPRNFINDPNGLVFLDGEYHLFYQHNPEGDRWGHMSWGHAVSRDLVRWEHLPIALREEAAIMIFSGSAVFDAKNTSGLGRPDAPPMVAVYTGHGHEKQTQNLASSVDRRPDLDEVRGQSGRSTSVRRSSATRRSSGTSRPAAGSWRPCWPTERQGPALGLGRPEDAGRS